MLVKATMCCEQSNDIITLFESIGRAAASQFEHLRHVIAKPHAHNRSLSDHYTRTSRSGNHVFQG